MGRLSTLTILLTLGAWGTATAGAPQERAASSTESARPPAPVPPVQYLEAGARLFNSGQYDLAARYITAAQSYRDQLSSSEQTILDAYLREMAKAPVPAPAPAAPVVASAPTSDPAVAQASRPVTASPSSSVPLPAPAQETGDVRQQAKWLLQAAREETRLGNYDDAAMKVEQARALNVRWGLFDDTPDKVAEALEKARPKAMAAVEPTETRDRDAARVKLKEARAALDAKNFEQAEAIALEIKSWNLTFGLFEDSPDKVAAAARALRRRDVVRNSSPREQPSQGVYEVLVREARELSSAGKFDEAEAKAKQAQRMNVVPAITADRAESVLHDIAMIRARQTPKGDAAVAVAAADGPEPTPSFEEPASVKAEREADELLAKGDEKAAIAKFAEADKLRAREAGAPALETNVPALSDSPAGAPPAPVAAIDAPEPPEMEAPSPVNAPVPSMGRGEQLLTEANALYRGGNYPAARLKVQEAKLEGIAVAPAAEEVLARIAVAEQASALGLYESALDAVRKGEVPRAKSLLNEVLANGESLDEGMRAKVASLLEKLPKDDTGKATATDRLTPVGEEADALAAQKLNAEVGTKIAEARRLQETDPDKAIAMYEQTLKGVKAAGLSDNLSRTMVRRLEVAIELAKKDKVVFDAKMQDATYRAEIERKRLRVFEADAAKKARVKDFMDKAQAAMSEGRYLEAESFAKRASEVDPDNVAATIIAWKARAERRYKRDMENKSLKEDGAVTAFQEVDLAAIADPEVQLQGIKYARNFKDLTKERLRTNARLEVKKDPRTLAIESKLKDSVSLNMDKQPLSEAISFLQNYTGMNIVLDPKALSDENVTSVTPVTLTANNISLKTALKLLLRPLGLTYKVEDDVLLITSPQASLESTFVKTYYVGDLMMPPGKPKAGPLGLPTPESVNTPNGGIDAAALGNGLGITPGINGAGTSVSERPNIDMTPLIQLVTSSIAPNSWRVSNEAGQDVTAAYGMGGGFGADGLGDSQPIGSITPFFLSISLIIRHTAEVHDQVADLLRQLRRLQDLQVSIEVRFISVSDNFFEQIGVNFDFAIQSDVTGPKASFAIPNPAAAFGNLGGGGGAGGGLGGGGAGGGLGGGGAGGGLGGGGAGGGLGGGGAGGGLGGGGAGGGLGGGGAGGGLGGGGAGGGLGGGGAGGGVGGAGGGGGITPYLVNPIRDHSLGNKLPVTVGLSAGGIGGFTPDLSIPFTQGSAALTAPVNAVPGAGATFGIAFLSDLEVYLFLTAAQGDTRTNVLQAPKVTTFNGAGASIFNTTQINFVSGLTPIVGLASVAFTPQVTSFPDGVFLFVTPVVSSDRRYVRLSLSPFFTGIEGFDSISIPAAVGGTGFVGGGGTINATIQLPRFTLTSVSTTVTVPDGGTVLLGGVKRLNEERREFGVPVLSKTPWINRLFRNVGIGRVTSSLMLMVTPRIIILEEEEERLGIPTIAL